MPEQRGRWQLGKGNMRALGDELDGVLLDPSEWDTMMDLLNKAQSGRAVLLPAEYDTPFGIRSASFRPDGFYLNGEKIFIISDDLETLKNKVKDKRLPLD